MLSTVSEPAIRHGSTGSCSVIVGAPVESGREQGSEVVHASCRLTTPKSAHAATSEVRTGCADGGSESQVRVTGGDDDSGKHDQQTDTPGH